MSHSKQSRIELPVDVDQEFREAAAHVGGNRAALAAILRWCDADDAGLCGAIQKGQTKALERGPEKMTTLQVRIDLKDHARLTLAAGTMQCSLFGALRFILVHAHDNHDDGIGYAVGQGIALALTA